ncbi:LamG domain-containing protein, partial [Patescibacteria group bacterium]|nr:LamG domain-containing protein [Patescibacteria group bacterium]
MSVQNVNLLTGISRRKEAKMRKSSLLFIVIFIGLFLFLVSANEFSDTIQGDFDNGTYNWTFYNTSGFVQLNSSRLNGTFTSQVFNAGSSSVWNNISWTSGGIGELPNSQLDEINTNTWPSTNINMTGNVLLMHMNEASGTIVDYSRTGNNGTAVGGPTYGVAGKFNTAMSFEGGNEGISLSNDVSLNPSAAMTVSAWIYIDTGNTQYGSILTRWNNGNAYYIGTLPNSYAVVIYFSGSLRYTTPALPTGEWVHFLVTNNGAGNTVSYYQNGAYVGGGASGGAIASSTSVSSIGYDVQRVNYPFKGDIDEFAIWNRTLSTTEILDVYKRGAERLNLSVQSCDDAACSGESFTNSGANLTSPYTLPIADNTFFQYKFEFETDNVSYSPELYNVTMGYTLLDTTAPEITLANLSDGYNTSSQDLTFNFTAVENYPQDMNCSLYIDSSFIMGNTTVQNNTLTNLNASSIAEGTHLWNVTCLDGAGNQNWSATRTFTVDLSAPSITSIVYSPNASGEVDPSTNLVFNATVSDDVVSVSEVILQYYNGTGWANSTMTNNSATNYNATITSISTETNYTFNIWANDTFGNSNSSANQTFDSIWDCTWSATSDLGQVAGFDENKWAGNITINNTGDATYASSNCSLDFRLTHDLSEGRIYYDGSYYKPSSTYTLVAKSNTTIEINATFQDEVIEESAIITINEISSRSSTSSRNTTATLVSTTGGPYLFQTITSNPSLLDLTFQNFSLNAYVRNLVGDDTVNNTAYNVSFNWSLPNNFLVKDGNSSLSYGNISDNTLIYNNINVSFNSTNLPNLSPGTISINLYAQGFNSSGTVITHAGNITLLTKQINISLSCYSTSDGVYVTACGSLDPDQPEESTAATGAAGGGGGGGGGGTSKTESVKTNAGFQLVRGKENEVEVAFENSDKNES